MKIALDVDGVLADFNTPFIDLLNSLGAQIPQSYVPHCWHYARELGVPQATVDAAWDLVAQSDTFWLQLPFLPGHHLVGELDNTVHELFFITSRTHGQHIKSQTEGFLDEMGICFPTVLVSPFKGSLCSALGIDVFLDDYPQNCVNVHASSPGTRTYLLDQPWNRTTSGSYTRMGSIERFCQVENLFGG